MSLDIVIDMVGVVAAAVDERLLLSSPLAFQKKRVGGDDVDVEGEDIGDDDVDDDEVDVDAKAVAAGIGVGVGVGAGNDDCDAVDLDTSPSSFLLQQQLLAELVVEDTLQVEGVEARHSNRCHRCCEDEEH